MSDNTPTGRRVAESRTHYGDERMNAEGWRRTIGADLFDHLESVARERAAIDDDPPFAAIVADVLSHACEMGFTAPVRAPRVAPDGARTLWPTGSGKSVAVLTTTGLLDYYHHVGHRWFLLRVPQLLRAVRGPLAARLQELLALYEAQCLSEGVSPLPPYADCRMFVGGENAPPVRDLIAQLSAETHGEKPT